MIFSFFFFKFNLNTRVPEESLHKGYEGEEMIYEFRSFANRLFWNLFIFYF